VKTIFLDLDDVCNQFMPTALKYLGCNIDNLTGRWRMDIVTMANLSHPTKTFSRFGFWNLFNREFWATIPVSEEFADLFDYCVDLVGLDNICILSRTVETGSCFLGKLDWIREHFPKQMYQQYLFGTSKYFCANADTLLIDDDDSNIRMFRKHGGQGLLIPRLWNNLYYVDTTTHISTFFNKRLP